MSKDTDKLEIVIDEAVKKFMTDLTDQLTDLSEQDKSTVAALVSKSTILHGGIMLGVVGQLGPDVSVDLAKEALNIFRDKIREQLDAMKKEIHNRQELN